MTTENSTITAQKVDVRAIYAICVVRRPKGSVLIYDHWRGEVYLVRSHQLHSEEKR